MQQQEEETQKFRLIKDKFLECLNDENQFKINKWLLEYKDKYFKDDNEYIQYDYKDNFYLDGYCNTLKEFIDENKIAITNIKNNNLDIFINFSDDDENYKGVLEIEDNHVLICGESQEAISLPIEFEKKIRIKVVYAFKKIPQQFSLLTVREYIKKLDLYCEDTDFKLDIRKNNLLTLESSEAIYIELDSKNRIITCKKKSYADDVIEENSEYYNWFVVRETVINKKNQTRKFFDFRNPREL